MDRWFALSSVIASKVASSPFSRMGYKVTAAKIEFVAEQDDLRAALDIKLRFEGGSILITSIADGAAEPFEAPIAHIGRRPGAGVVLFGEGIAQRRTAVTSVIVEGDTPLTGLGTTKDPSTSYFDTDITAIRYFWQLDLSD